MQAGTYIGKGKIRELKEMIALTGATGIICDDELSPAQMRNLESELETKIMDRTMNGESVYPSEAPKVQFGKITRSDLTDRELELLRELTSGMTNEEIADKLQISVNTVKRHIQNIMEKTGFESRLDLATNAKLLGLVVSDRDRLKE